MVEWLVVVPMELFIKQKFDCMVRETDIQFDSNCFVFSIVGYVALKELNFVSPTPTQFQAFRNEVLALKFVYF